MMKGYRQMRGVFNMYDEPQKGVFETYDEPELSNEGACLGYMMHRRRQSPVNVL